MERTEITYLEAKKLIAGTDGEADFNRINEPSAEMKNKRYFANAFEVHMTWDFCSSENPLLDVEDLQKLFSLS